MQRHPVPYLRFTFKQGAITTKHIFANGAHVATVERPNGTTSPIVSYVHADYLGKLPVILQWRKMECAAT